jgi:hypothetical protein
MVFQGTLSRRERVFFWSYVLAMNSFAERKAAMNRSTIVHVRHAWPPVMKPPVRGKWVLMQPWEFGSLPKAWLPMFRQVDEVWVYSRYVRGCYLEAEVPRDKIHVVPLGAAPEILRPGLEPTETRQWVVVSLALRFSVRNDCGPCSEMPIAPITLPTCHKVI